MNIYRVDDAGTGGLRAGLGRGCTLMQWFILFGLRASWTSSIIVIHRRKWAARGGAGASGAPRAVLSREPTLSPPTRESRDARCLRLTHSIAIRVCVPSPYSRSELVEPRAVPSHPVHQEPAGQPWSPRPAAQHQRDTGISRSTADAQLISRRNYRLRTHGECDQSLHANFTSFDVFYFESLAKFLPMDGLARVDHPATTLARKGDNFADLHRCYKCERPCW